MIRCLPKSEQRRSFHPVLVRILNLTFADIWKEKRKQEKRKGEGSDGNEDDNTRCQECFISMSSFFFLFSSLVFGLERYARNLFWNIEIYVRGLFHFYSSLHIGMIYHQAKTRHCWWEESERARRRKRRKDREREKKSAYRRSKEREREKKEDEEKNGENQVTILFGTSHSNLLFRDKSSKYHRCFVQCHRQCSRISCLFFRSKFMWEEEEEEEKKGEILQLVITSMHR